jgi:hypothetical protein
LELETQELEKDRKTLHGIAAALDEVGRQLDAADRMPGHDPWPAIARQGATVRDLAGMLSARFRRAHPDLVARLSGCTNLHLAWGSLQDEVGRAVASVDQEMAAADRPAADPWIQ